MEIRGGRPSTSMVLKSTVFVPVVVASFLFLPTASSATLDNLIFSYSSFNQTLLDINLEGDATVNSSSIQLTKVTLEESLNSTGWATYKKPVHLWDNSTGLSADFSTRFTFIIDSRNNATFAQGITFFLVPNGTQRPPATQAGWFLGLPVGDNSVFHPFLAVEFDTFTNDFDPGYVTGVSTSKPHVGIDINSTKSIVNEMWDWNKIMSGGKVQASITYDSSAGKLNVLLIDESDSSATDKKNLSLSYEVNLKNYLPEWVTIGFSGCTGYIYWETNQILSWEFSSSPSNDGKKKRLTWVWVVISFAGAIGLFVAIAAMAGYLHPKREAAPSANNDQELGNTTVIDEEFEQVAGPRKFSYNELAIATHDFAADRLLGEGGFGMVYQGYLRGSGSVVAIKKIRANSKQGLKEYVAEVKTVGQLRHRSLVQLMGWCHKNQELLVVYEFMSNGSLDSHLFDHKTLLTWEVRYRIAEDLALAILYLHEEWVQCVVHRDIKCSNVMLDSSFSAKLGDFGLARLVDHEKGSQTTMLAGTMGYLAPECVYTGRSSKESDVYSFGIVVLEIACGRRVIELIDKEGRFQLVQWVWELYESDNLLDAADPMLRGRYNRREMELMMMLGLWCAHPDHALRPSIRDALNALKSKDSLPPLPLEMPSMKNAGPHNMPQWSLVSSSTTTSSKTSYANKSSAWTSSSLESTTSPSPMLLNAR
ncbi:hypothetical protein SAY86_020433 [Trapa natans]|uniref:non-specific serine/threonine protein kinase n=1 Tax=Trapa natans TaxID=22666 RepID=A0AAN7LPT5_TRANT|nr:hypothetical protein SAY86_020433 [Trapa natans]